MHTLNDVHQQFAAFFKSEKLQPFAYLVSKKLGEGHICLRLDDLDDEIAELPPHYRNISEKRHNLQNEPLVALQPGDRQPFVLYNNQLYLQRYFMYETLILNRIMDFVQTEASVQHERSKSLRTHAALISDMFAADLGVPESAGRANWQLAAALSAVLNNFSIITGGPGTGKTTTVAKILAILYAIHPELKVALAAPTGKAAARMAESLKSASVPVNVNIAAKFKGLEPSTLHRLLGYISGSSCFKHDHSNPLNYDVVIVDESSMIDAALFAKLLDAVDPNTRLVLLGDKDQLASVEAGSLFGDLCQARDTLNLFSEERAALINSFNGDRYSHIAEPNITPASAHPLFQHVIELKHSHRFNDDQGIGKFSKAVIRGDEDTLKAFTSSQNDGQVLIDTGYSQKLFEEFADGYAEFIREKDVGQALQKMNKLRVLCAVREGEQGLYSVNRRIEKYLEQKKLIRLNGEFYENRPVIVTGNNYTIGLFNGDTGIVRPDDNGAMKVWFDDGAGGIKPVLPGYISRAETVFAMTIHKSQGSEFNRVLVILPADGNMALLTRELLYTAVTRARSTVYLQGTEAVILKASSRFVKRASGIAARFIQ